MYTYFKLLLLPFTSIFILGCNLNSLLYWDGSSNLDPGDDSSTPALTLSNFQISGASATEVSFTFDYSGDSNGNSNVTVHFCSIKAQAGCEPIGSESINLYKSGNQIIASIDISSSAVTPGDFLKYKIVASDNDGLSGGDESGFVFIPLNETGAMGLKQLNQFAFGANIQKGFSFTSNDIIQASVKDSQDNLFVAGYTKSSISEPSGGFEDAFILKLKPNGEIDTSFGIKGVVQLGLVSNKNSSSADRITSLVLDSSGNLFAAGYTTSALGGAHSGNNDGFILKINATTGVFDTTFGDGDGNDDDGILQINNSQSASAITHDNITSLALDDSGNLFAAGQTYSDLGGTNSGSSDGFILKLNATTGVFNTTFGDGDGNDDDGILQINDSQSNSATSSDNITSLALDDSGNLFAAGYTYSALGGAHSGSEDGFILKLNATTGVFDTTFGDGDGNDDDGILQINNSQSNSATSWDYITSLTLDDSGNLFAAGHTGSDLGGAHSGNNDGFILKLNTTTGVFDTTFGDGDGNDDDGILQINNSQSNSAIGWDRITSLALDDSGNLFAAGYTESALGGAHSGSEDGFILKLNANTGAFDTTFGDGDGNDDDGILQINNSQSNSATSSDNITSLALDDSGNLFAAGYTSGALGGAHSGSEDGFILKLNATTGVFDTTFGDGDGNDDDGILQINDSQSASASSFDRITSLALDDSGNLFAAGYTESALGGTNSGNYDGFILKLSATTGAFDATFGDGDGNDDDGILQINNSQSNSATSWDYITSLALDDSGNLFAAGYTSGALGGANSGSEDGFILKLNATTGVFDTTFGDGDGNDDDGILQINDSQSASASSSDSITSLVLDDSGNLFAAGSTQGALGGAHSGNNDGFILKLNATTGVFDTTFGDGDGNDDDGILQINDSQSNSATSSDYITSLALDDSGNLFAAGYTYSALEGANSGSSDGFILQCDENSGVIP